MFGYAGGMEKKTHKSERKGEVMKLKKLSSVLLASAMVVSLAACGGSGDSGKEASDDSTDKAAEAITSIDQLEGKTIGVQTGTTGDIYVTDEFGEDSVERYNKGFEAVQALQQGKIDAVIIDNEPAQVFVDENEGLKILDEAYTEEEYAIAVSKDNTELTEQLNEALAALKEDGTFDAIFDYYISGEGEPYAIDESVEREGQFIMATNAEFPPYEFHDTVDGEDKIMGVDADVARAICDYLGKELVIEDMAFDSIITAVQGGKADVGFAGMTVTEDRLKSVDFTDTYCTARQVVIVKE